MSRAALTPAGWALLGLAGGALAVGLVLGDNAVLLVGAVLAAPLLAEAALGRGALREVEVARELPAELFADRPADGAVVVRAPRAGAVRVVDEAGGVDVGAPGGAEVRVPVRWRLPRRGRIVLPGLAVWTTWPLGLVRRERWVERPVELLVAPRPRPADPRPREVRGTHDLDDGEARGPLGDLLGLRPHGEGERWARIHWPTTARRGEPHVVERGHGLDADPWVEVPETEDPDAWELALERACGAILAARGPVGLSLLGRRHGPGDGAAFRRRLLALLADAPVRGRR